MCPERWTLAAILGRMWRFHCRPLVLFLLLSVFSPEPGRHPLTDLSYLCLGRVPCATLKEGKPGPFCRVAQGSTTGNGWWPRVCHQLCLVVNPGLPHTQLLRLSRQLGPSGSEFRGPMSISSPSEKPKPECVTHLWGCMSHACSLSWSSASTPCGRIKAPVSCVS